MANLREDLDALPLASLAEYVDLEGEGHEAGDIESGPHPDPHSVSHHHHHDHASHATHDDDGQLLADGPHKCGECDKEFVTRAGLSAHRDRAHVLDPALASVIESDSTPAVPLTPGGRNVLRPTTGVVGTGGSDKAITRAVPHQGKAGVVISDAASVANAMDDNIAAETAATLVDDRDQDHEAVVHGDDLSHATGPATDLQSYDTTTGVDGKLNGGTVSRTDGESSGQDSGTRVRTATGDRWVCDRCGQKFARQPNVRAHIRAVHEKRRDFACGQCDMAFSTRGTLETHIRVIHLRRRDFLCTECGKSFGSQGSLTVHTRTVHRGEANFPCQQCDKAFGTKGNLRRHINSVHTLARTYPCTQCDRVYKQSGDLSRHIRVVHEHRRDFVCSRCGKSFGWKRDLLRHVNSLHFKRKHECTACGALYSEKCHLLRHQRKAHPTLVGAAGGGGTIRAAGARAGAKRSAAAMKSGSDLAPVSEVTAGAGASVSGRIKAGTDLASAPGSMALPPPDGNPGGSVPGVDMSVDVGVGVDDNGTGGEDVSLDHLGAAPLDVTNSLFR